MISSAQLILACDIYWQIESPKIPSSDWGARQSGGEKSRASPPSLLLARTSLPLIAPVTLRWQTPVCGAASSILGWHFGDSAGSTEAHFFSYETYGLGLQKMSRDQMNRSS
jgi:hypothetical protein